MKKSSFRFMMMALLFIFLSEASNAKLVQILHTNDTHSYLENSTHNSARGGAARLKGLIDFYKNKMTVEGVKTLVMDAGDFAEGNLYYMADRGRKVFEVHNEMGYDVGVLGNHDYLMGSRDLDNILGEMDLKFSFLAANLKINDDYKNIQSKIKAFEEFEIDGVKIAVLGLTTNEIFYKWRLEGGQISNPYKAAKHYEEILKKRKNDYIIALTHIGLLNDIKLAERTKHIDLIIGGHSHTALFQPAFGINKNKLKVPIVQAGMHTEYLGRLIVDLEVGQPLKIVSYELIPVITEENDLLIKSIVEEAKNDLNNNYGKDWLNEKIGFSDLKNEDQDGSRKWAYFITDTIKEKSEADVGIHMPAMNGENFPVGDISRRDLINSIPRVFDLDKKEGWTIYTSKVKGLWLGLLFESLTHFGRPLTFSGITIDYKKTIMGLKISGLLINGKRINPLKFYKVAFTEGIIRGAKGIGSYTSAILRKPVDTHLFIWNSLEEKLKNSNFALNIANISEENHSLFMPNLENELEE